MAADSRKEWTPAPEGLHKAVLVDMVDLGIVDGSFGPRHKVRAVWQIEDVSPDDGKRFQVSKMYTLSLNEKANLRKDLETWRGKKFTADELKGFDLEKLVGVNCQLQLIHNITDEGRTYSNVQAIIPLGKGEKRISAQEYIRVKYRADIVNKPLTEDESGDIPF
jgi:hypothetical protein